MMKKILSLAVAAALALTLSLSAFAAAGDTNMLLEMAMFSELWFSLRL